MYIFREILIMADADDDSWLYGDDNDEEETTAEEAPPKAPSLDPEQTEELEAPPPIEDGDADTTVEEEKAEREKSQAPVYMVKLRDTDAILGSTASFMIHVRGNPNPEVQL